MQDIPALAEHLANMVTASDTPRYRTVLADNIRFIERELTAALTEARAQGAAEERERLAKDPTQFKIGYALACANVVNAHEEPDIAADVLAEEFWDRQSVYSIHDWTDSDRRAFKEIFACRHGMWPYRRSNTGEG